MLGPLPPLAPEWAPYEDSFHEIARIVLLATGFVLIPVAVPGPDLARALGLWLSQAGHRVIVHELIGDAEWETLAGFLMSPSPPDAVVMVIGPSAPPRGVSGPLGLVNQARDAIVRNLRRPLLWCGSRSFLNVTWQNAPDFWSIRSVDHSLSPAVTPGAAAPAPAPPTDAIVGPAPAGPTPLPTPQDTLVREAIAQGDQVSAAILAAREADAALSDGRADEALRLVDGQLAPGSAVPGEMRLRLMVVRARAFSMLGRMEDARTELDALLAMAGLSPEVELDAMLERARLDLDELGNEDAHGAEERFARALFLAGQVGSAEGGIRARIGLGEAALERGQTEEARRILAAAAADAQALQDERVIQAARAAVHRASRQSHDAAMARRMAGASRLDPEHLHQVYEAAIKAGLAERRGELLASINPAVVASLPFARGPASQLRGDLSELNRVEGRGHGEHPLDIWLRRAASLAAPRPEAAVFTRALAMLGATPPAPSDERTEAAARPAQEVARAKSVPLGSSGGIGMMDAPLCVVVYADNDRDAAKRLRSYVAPLLRAGLARWWSRSQIAPGEEVSVAIGTQIRQADVLIVLVSPSLHADETTERWLEEALRLGKRIVPILLDVDLWEHSPLAGLRVLPANGKPISMWSERSEAWQDVVRGLRGVLTGLNPRASGKP